MSHQLIESDKDKLISYESLIIPPKKLSVLGSNLCLKIINELVKEPGCAMDLSRKLGEHEQNIYYHLRKLESAGIVKKIRTERRYGMLANIYSVVSPVIATKLYDAGKPFESKRNIRNPEIEKFLHPFIENGRINAKIIMGDPYPHGRYDSAAKISVYTFDLILLLGNIIQNFNFPHYKLDVHMSENDLNDNLILFGNVKNNTIIDKLNEHLPVYFNPEEGWHIVSKNTNKVYSDPRIGVILKIDNPFNKNKKILIFGSLRSRGMRTCIISFTEYFNEITKNLNNYDNFIRIVEGFDKTGDGIIDAVKILE